MSTQNRSMKGIHHDIIEIMYEYKYKIGQSKSPTIYTNTFMLIPKG